MYIHLPNLHHSIYEWTTSNEYIIGIWKNANVFLCDYIYNNIYNSFGF